MSHSSPSFDLAELQLERELRQMFEVDSQKDLETYLTYVQELQEQSWTADIQTMYRAIHTIKGGSVTVGADAILQVATVLEDMLSELRYLESIPTLDDGRLKQMLQEGGEIIASVFGTEQNEAAVLAKVARIDELKQQIQENYLAHWNEQTQIQIEFAEEGFDLVVLDLEVAVNNLPQEGEVSDNIIELATQLIEELDQIGAELELTSGWTTLLENASELLQQPDAALWKAKWTEYFQSLKTCAKQGGVASFEGNSKNCDAEDSEPVAESSLDRVGSILDEIDWDEDSEAEDSELEAESSLDRVGSILDEIDLTEDSEPVAKSSLDKVGSILDEIDLTEDSEPVAKSSLDTVGNILDEIDWDEDNNTEASEPVADTLNIDRIDIINSEENTGDKTAQISAPPPKLEPLATENIQVPVPLAKLDLSAQSIVDTLMIARTMESFYQNLHQDVIRLTGIAKDSVRYLAQLRQIQNDYTLLNDLDRQITQKADSPTLERYRSGYITINRLLENSLRLSEIGTEAQQTAQETAERLQQLNKSITQLKDIVEDSRLIPFRNLSFRVRAIVRDLITRYGKSVNLTVRGEQIELDVGTTKRLEPILLHLVRNAYDHGLETPAERTTKGKPEQGNLNLTLQRYGSTYTLTLQDDGKGIDASAIEAKAQKLNLPLTRTDTPSELLSVICQAGFSSRTEVSEVSGRGVGMDVVAQQIMLLNGSLSLDTIKGKGTTFKINFPVPHLLVPCLLIQSSDRIFAIPTEQIVTTSLWESLDASRVTNTEFLYEWEITYQGNTTPGLNILSYWYPQLKNRVLDRGTTLPTSAIAVFVRPQSAASGFWLLADKMLGRLELKIQPFPAPLIAPRGVMGVGLQTDSSLIPVIEVNSLQEYLVNGSASVTITATPEDTEELNSKADRESQTILIVDDAALMRRRIEASLAAYGYTTHTCADGLEAWNWLKMNPQPMLMITDVEMPNMDGFTLIDRCRDRNLTFPILVVSSRLAEEWAKEAQRVGATDFLTKGFSTGELVNKVNSLLD